MKIHNSGDDSAGASRRFFMHISARPKVFGRATTAYAASKCPSPKWLFWSNPEFGRYMQFSRLLRSRSDR